MALKNIHYIEIGVLDGLRYVKKFLSEYSFRLAAKRETSVSKQWLLSCHEIRVLVTELSAHGQSTDHDPYLHSWAFPASDKKPQKVGDSVFNIAFCVEGIDNWVARLSGQNVQFVKPLRTVSDDHGSVRVCMVRSCIGNVVHTLVDDAGYSGPFLPGFQITAETDNGPGTVDKGDQSVEPSQPSELPLLHFIDHVAACVPMGSSDSVISWYENCFDLKRFLVNREDDLEKGLVIQGRDMGLRLKSIQSRGHTDTEHNRLTFVIAEKLPNEGSNQLDTFLANHGGHGVHHVAFSTTDIIEAVRRLRANGVNFNDVPPTYYTEAGKLKDMIAAGVDVDLIRKNGILIDVEMNMGHSAADHNGDSASKRCQHLMQTFTRPLAEVDSFYLEVIQRVGATGFGSANITALWKSVQAYLQHKEAQSARTSSG